MDVTDYQPMMAAAANFENIPEEKNPGDLPFKCFLFKKRNVE